MLKPNGVDLLTFLTLTPIRPPTIMTNPPIPTKRPIHLITKHLTLIHILPTIPTLPPLNTITPKIRLINQILTRTTILANNLPSFTFININHYYFLSTPWNVLFLCCCVLFSRFLTCLNLRNFRENFRGNQLLWAVPDCFGLFCCISDMGYIQSLNMYL